MRTLRCFLKRLTWWKRRQRDEERLQLEIEEHIALQTAENLRAGLSLEEARRQALLKFGGIVAAQEGYRDQQGLPVLEALFQDVRYAMRRLRNSPAFTLTTVLMLALGIGATTSMFTLVDAVLLKSLAVADPASLVRLGKQSRCCYWGGYSQDQEYSLVSYPLYKYFRDNTKEFSELAAFSASDDLFGVRREGSADPAQSFPGEFVSGNYFRMFGVHAYAGRALTPADDRPNAPLVAVMSYRLWRERYGSDPSVIGSVFDLSEKPYTVVGIAPPGFYGDTLRPSPPDFFLPLSAENYGGNGDLNEPDTYWLDVIGRVRPGAKISAIESKMRVELKQWLRSHWGEMSANDRALFPQQTLFLRPGGAGITSMREQYEHWLNILMIASGFVLLIVCANVANLMLVRGMERRRQIALSVALGARASRIVKQALTESVLLSLAGGLAGLTIAYAATFLILHFAFPANSGWAGVPIEAAPSMTVLLFAFGISLLTGIAFGIAPAYMATRVDAIDALRGAGRSTARTGSGLRRMLVVLQAALALVLLSASGLLMMALQRLEYQDFGFQQDRRIIVNYDPRLAGYANDQLSPLYRRIEDAVARIPGVSSVALCIYSPLSDNNWGAGVWVNGTPTPGPNDDVMASFDRVTPGYFEVTGDPILRGRPTTEQDTANSLHVAVINEALARKYFKNEDPIGKYFGRLELGQSHQYEIVGIAKDARYLNYDLDKPVGPFFFLPAEQHDASAKDPTKEADPGSHYLRDIVILTKPGASVTAAQLRQAIASVDPNLPVISIHSLRQQVADAFRQERLIARLTSFFGVLSLVLSCIGLYGVTAYNAGQRTSEIGIRMALGADRRGVVALVLRGAFGLIFVGLLIGLPLTFAAGPFLGRQLYGMAPYSPMVTFFAASVLGLCALVASFIPAFRASLISPIDALRVE